MEFKLSPEQEERILKNQRLVYYFVKQLNIFPNDSEYEDCIQIGMVGLVKASITFDETKEIKFATYAAPCIKNELKMYFRRNNKYLTNISLNTTVCEDTDGDELCIEDIVFDSSATEFVEKFENIENIEELVRIILNCFSMKEIIVLMYSIGGVRQAKIGEIFNYSQSYISRVERKVRKKLKQYVGYNKKVEEKLFSVEIVEDMIRIIFFTEDIEKLKKAFTSFLLKISNSEKLKDFSTKYTNGKVIMEFLAETRSFALIAGILQEIQKYQVNILTNVGINLEEDVQENDGNNVNVEIPKIKIS